MSDLSHNQELQRDLLRDSLPEGFEEHVFQATLHSAVSRRRIRTTTRAIAALTVLFAGWFAVHRLRDNQPPLQTAALPAKPQEAVINAPHQTLRTIPFERVILTKPSSVAKIVSTSESMNILKTSDFAGYFPSRINDDQLLAFLDGRPAALVRSPAGEAEIILFNDKEEPVAIPENGLEIPIRR